jgi:hypothetical protein
MGKIPSLPKYAKTRKSLVKPKLESWENLDFDPHVYAYR